MKNTISLMFLSFLFCIVSCGYFGPHPEDMTGNFKVQFSLDEKIVNTDEIRDKLTKSINETGDSLRKVQQSVDSEWDLDEIDTSTAEGKLTYISGKFARNMTELGADLGLLGKDLGNTVGDLVENIIKMGGNAFKNIHFQVELQKDGDIKMNDIFSRLAFSHSRWEVDGNNFLIFDSQNKETPTTFTIIERNKKGFVLKNESLTMNFLRQE